MTTGKKEILDEAIQTVAGRGKSYGSVAANFGAIARLWNAHLMNRYADGYGGDTTIAIPTLDGQDVSLMMTLMKIARLENDTSHHDSWVDIAGYSACGGELAAYQRDLP